MSFQSVSISLTTLYGAGRTKYIYKMKSTFPTQLPHTPRPSIRRSDEQDETARYGTTMEHMTTRAARAIDRTICDTIGGTINQERRHETGYQATSRIPMPYIIETKTPRHSTRTTGRGAGWYLASDDYGTMRAFSFSSLSCRIPIRIPDYRFVVLGGWRGVASPFQRLARSVRGAGRRPVSRSVAQPRFPLFSLPYSAIYSADCSTLPCLVASMS